ncbi:hypothetical protein D3C81_758930 [compost metagenome]
MDRPAFDHVRRRARGQLYLFLGAKQDHIRQRAFHRIADAPRSVARIALFRLWQQHGTLGRGDCLAVGQRSSAAPYVAQMAGVHAQVARERAAQRLVGGDQGFEPFVDLTVGRLALLLHRLHHQQADAHADQGDDGQTDQGGEQALP